MNDKPVSASCAATCGIHSGRQLNGQYQEMEHTICSGRNCETMPGYRTYTETSVHTNYWYIIEQQQQRQQ